MYLNHNTCSEACYTFEILPHLSGANELTEDSHWLPYERVVGYIMWLALKYDDVIKWKHFPRYWPFVRGIHRWILLTKANDAELWCFLWSTPEQTVKYYSTGVQIVSCTLSDDSVLSESTGLFNPVLCVSQWNLFWQKNQPMRLCLSNQVRSAREGFPSPLGDFIRLFEVLIGELFKYDIVICFIFLNDISLAPKMWICIIALLVKQAECSVHFTIKK